LSLREIQHESMTDKMGILRGTEGFKPLLKGAKILFRVTSKPAVLSMCHLATLLANKYSALFAFCIDRCGRVFNTPVSYSGYLGFKSQPAAELQVHLCVSNISYTTCLHVALIKPIYPQETPNNTNLLFSMISLLTSFVTTISITTILLSARHIIPS
jgi:hypothetical protein